MLAPLLFPWPRSAPQIFHSRFATRFRSNLHSRSCVSNILESCLLLTQFYFALLVCVPK